MSDVFYALPFVACPVGMGLMMYFMMRGGHNDSGEPAPTADEVARLRAEVDQLKAFRQEADL